MRILELNCSNNDVQLQNTLREHIERAGHEYLQIRAADISLVLKAGTVKVYVKDQMESFLFQKAFVRGRGIHAHMTSLLMRMLRRQKTEIFGSQSAGEFTHNDGKITQMVDLTQAQLPIPHTIVFSHKSFPYVEQIFHDHDFMLPAVLKRTGSKGSCVWKVASFSEIETFVQETSEGELYILQELIPNTFDIRALYFCGNLLGAMARTSTDGFYNNASKGAGVDMISLTEEEDVLSRKACQVLGQDFAGVDIVRSERGPLFFEINNRPGYEGFERATGISVGEEIAKIILSQTPDSKE